jgi:hypothetical protein
MPSTAWLAEMLTQLLEASTTPVAGDPSDCHVRRYRDRLHLTPKLAELEERKSSTTSPARRFVWRGNGTGFPAYGGVLHFEPAETGWTRMAAAATTGDRIPPWRRTHQAGRQPPDARSNTTTRR